MNPRSLMLAILALVVAVSTAAADPIYRIDVIGKFTAGGTLRDFTNKGGPADTIDLTGLPVAFSLTFDLGAAPADAFTATDPNTNSIQSTSVPFFVTGQVDIGSVVNKLQALGNAADLPVPNILQLTPLPGGTSSNIDQKLFFTQFAAGADAVIADTQATSQNNSPLANIFLGWNASVLANSVNQALPLGNYAVQGYPSFTYNFSTPGTGGNAIFGVTDSNLSFTANAFTTQFVITGANGNANIALSTVSGRLVTPEPRTGFMVTPALLAIGAILLRKRRQLANCGHHSPR